MGLFTKSSEQKSSQNGATSEPAYNSNPDLPIAAVVVEDDKPLKSQQVGGGGVQATVFIDTRRPVHLTCPHCGTANVKTTTRTAPSFLTWVAAGVTLIVLWPVCWLPLVLDSCKHTQHFCPNCSREVGEVRAFSDCCVSHRG